MQLKDIMTTHVQGISADQSIQHAAETMRHLNVGAIPVFRNDEPVGIVTDRDIAIRGVANGCDCASPVSEIMSEGLVTLPEHTSVDEASQLMQERQIRRVLVVGEEGKIVGIVSVGDLVAKLDRQKMAAELIAKVSEPAEPVR